MLKSRIIPVLQINKSSAIKTINFFNERVVGDAIANVKIFSNRQADEMAIIDIGASRTGGVNHDFIKRLSKESNMPLAIGGGVRAVEDADKLFRSGADKIIINTLYYQDIDVLERLINKYGSQSIIFSLDVKYVDGIYVSYSNSGTIKQKENYLNTIEKLNKLNIGEYMINCIHKDGMMDGYDIQLLSYVEEQTNKPIIILGGCGAKNDMVEAYRNGANGFAASSVFHWVGESIITIKKYLLDFNIPVRKVVND
jgi:cyclase